MSFGLNEILSKRILKIEDSSTIKYSNRAKQKKLAGYDVIDFTLGEPDFDTPENIKQATIKSLNRGDTHYSAGPGILELREELSEKLVRENNIDTIAQNIIVTPGAKQAILTIMMVLIEKGDEVIIFDPSWVSYEACIKLAGGKPVRVPTDPEYGFKPVNLSEYITPKTKMIILNSPSNPTGAVYGKSILQEIADISIDNDIFVLADEIYEKIIYDNKHISIGSFPGMENLTFTVNGFSKAYAMTGWRIGYMNAPDYLVKPILKYQSHSISNVNTFIQYGALEAIKGPQNERDNMIAEFRERRDILVEGLNKLGFKCDVPQGAFYAYPDVSEYGTGEQVTDALLEEADIAVIPGIGFGKSGKYHIRISYASSVSRIKEALLRMDSLL